MDNSEKKPIIQVKDVDLFYGDFKALKKVNFDIQEKEITACWSLQKK